MGQLYEYLEEKKKEVSNYHDLLCPQIMISSTIYLVFEFTACSFHLINYHTRMKIYSSIFTVLFFKSESFLNVYSINAEVTLPVCNMY